MIDFKQRACAPQWNPVITTTEVHCPTADRASSNSLKVIAAHVKSVTSLVGLYSCEIHSIGIVSQGVLEAPVLDTFE